MNFKLLIVIASLVVTTTAIASDHESKKQTVAGVLSAKGTIRLVNNTNCDVTVGEKYLSTNAVFQGSKPIATISSGKKEGIKFNLDKGPYAVIGATTELECKVDANVDVEFGFSLWGLFNGGKVSAHFDSQASCEASLNASTVAGFGIFPTVSAIYSLHFAAKDMIVKGLGHFFNIRAEGIIALSHRTNTTISIGGEISPKSLAQNGKQPDSTTLRLSNSLSITEETATISLFRGGNFPETKITLSGNCIH